MMVKKKTKKTPKKKPQVNPLRYTTESGKVLSEKETKFVEKYIESNGERIPSIVEAYNIDMTKKGWHVTARVMAHENLTKPYILEAIREIYGKCKLNNETVDAELAFVIEQKAELNPKVKAIDIFNKISKRYDNTITFKGEIRSLSDEELRARIAGIVSGAIGSTLRGRKKDGTKSS